MSSGIERTPNDVASCDAYELQDLQSGAAQESLILISVMLPKFAESAHSLVGGHRSHGQMWTCCNCANSGMTIWQDFCTDCDHQRCPDCTVYSGRPAINVKDNPFDFDAHHSRFEYTAFEWNSKFTDREGLPARFYILEDRIAVEDAEAFDSSTPLTSQIILGRFLDYGCDGDRDRFLYRNVQVNKFLKGLDLGHLCTGTVSEVRIPLVLLDERRNYVTPSETAQYRQESSRRTICAHEFYKSLRKHQYCSARDTPHLNADRRTIYITDSNPYCILAILATVSPLQAAVLRDFIWRNLAFHAFIGVKLPAKGYKTFTLELHLPYYAWRRSGHHFPAKTQLNTTANPHRIRKYQSVKYLHKAQSGQLDTSIQEYIFEAQISVLVTGIDNRFWTAYSFVDVYFKSTECSETAEYYYQANEDPHSGGKDGANQVIWDAREFFLRILASRIEHVREEWNNVVSQLLQNIEPYADKIFSETPYANSSQTDDMTQDESYKWTIRMLRKYASHLSKTISRWETFKSGEIRFFFKPNSNVLADARYGLSLASVNRDVEELVVLRKSLLHQTEMFENMTNSMATHAALAENRTLRRQSDFIQALTIITIFYLPLNLASSIYSMQSSVLPELIQVSDYFYTLIGLTIATLVFVINLPHLMLLWQLVQGTSNQLWDWAAGKFKIFLNWTFARRKPPSDVDDQDLEMQAVERSGVTFIVGEEPVRRSTF